MNDDDREDGPARVLVLPKTRMAVEGGELIRREEAGGVMMRFPLDDVDAVRFVRPFNPYCLLPIGLAGGLVALGVWASEYNVLSVLLYVGAMFLAAFGMFGLRNDTLVLTVRGEEIRIDSPDTAEDVRGFAASLGSLIGGR